MTKQYPPDQTFFSVFETRHSLEAADSDRSREGADPGEGGAHARPLSTAP